MSGGIYFYFNQSRSTKPVATQPQTVPSSPTTSPAPAGAGGTANWKTYTNAEYKYSINYPANLQIKENNFASYKSTAFSSEYKPPFSNYFNFAIIVQTVKTDSDLKSWINDYVIQELPNGKKGSIVSGNIMPYKNDNLVGYYFVGGKESVNKYIFFKNKEFIFEVALSGSGTGGSYTENPNAEQLLDQILSTFKFIVQNPSPSSQIINVGECDIDSDCKTGYVCMHTAMCALPNIPENSGKQVNCRGLCKPK